VQVLKWYWLERFHECIGEIVLGMHVGHLNSCAANTFTDIMEFHVDVFDAVVK
jgi:hypothetical protein